MLDPAHPGEVLEELFLVPLGLSAGALARRLDVPRTRIERLVRRQTSMTADTALRLAAFFGNSPQFWLNLQDAHDLHAAKGHVDLSGIRPLDAA
ncbi:MAG: HigA family addiction module antitoxin [Amaricoccus sp.]|uniref:HigA family addiction module antitoxin n=1 Tax=Amaricoccus sp. TaxID=1872485 RepID=UPI0039E23979